MAISCSVWDLVPQPGMKPTPWALEAQSPIHWTAREVVNAGFLKSGTFITLVTAGEPGVSPAHSVLDMVNQRSPIICTRVGCLAPSSSREAPLLLLLPRPPWLQQPSHDNALSLLRLRAPRNPHTPRPEHDWPRRQLPIPFTTPLPHTKPNKKPAPSSLQVSEAPGTTVKGSM